MRRRHDRGEGMFSTIRLEERVPADHPLQAIRLLTDEVLAALDGRFEAMYSAMGRPSIAPEMLLRATLLQAFSSVRSELQLMERIDYNLLFHWFVGPPVEAVVWHPTVFSHNRARLMAAEVAQEFLAALMTRAANTAERAATLVMLDRKPGITLGADKAYDVIDLVTDQRARRHPPHRHQRHRVQTGRGPQNRRGRGDPPPVSGKLSAALLFSIFQVGGIGP